MKARIAIAAVLLASLVGFGFGAAVLAAPASPFTGVSGPRESITVDTNYAVDAMVPDGGSAVITSVPADNSLPNLPNYQYIGDAMTVTILDKNGVVVDSAPMTVCFATPNDGDISIWVPGSSTDTLFSVVQRGHWVYVPTTHMASWVCAQTTLPGTYSSN